VLAQTKVRQHRAEPILLRRNNPGDHWPMIDSKLRQRPPRRLFGVMLALALLAGCSEDPMGPENRFALIAFSQCNHAQALMLVEQAIEHGNLDNKERGLMLKAAILRDQGEIPSAEALYPEIERAWQQAKRKSLSPQRRERDIQMLIDIAHAERHAKKLDPHCRSKHAARSD
jgi:hypothetical protein